MQAETKRKIQLFLLAGIVIAAIYSAYTFYQRRAETTPEKRTEAASLNPDYYVTPKKLYPYDVKTTKEQLTQQPVWVKVGYSITYFPAAGSRVDFAHDAGKLLPLERLEVKDVVTGAPPDAHGETQVLAVFEKERRRYAFSVGSILEGNFKYLGNEMLFIEDPHALYKHWTADVWQAIGQHQVKPGMSELQADFAVGLGVPEGAGQPGNRTLDYPNGDKPLIVTYSNGKAVNIRGGV